jgi:hypothetical protein
VVVRGEVVELSRDVTVEEIRVKLPSELVEEFNERVENVSLLYLAAELSVWGMPLDKLLAYRREMAERLYRSVCVDWENAVIPPDLDVDVIIRTHGSCLLGTAEHFLSADGEEA